MRWTDLFGSGNRVRCVVALTAALGTITTANAQVRVGTVTTARNARLSAGSRSPFLEVRAPKGVRAGDGLRTLRRGIAEIGFTDGSVLRVNERTDLIVQDSIITRRIGLQRGAVWVSVAKGTPTSVETAVATATARGTEFVFESDGTLDVLESTVDLSAGGKTLPVHEGQSAEVGPDGKPHLIPFRYGMTPGGTSAVIGWWTSLFLALSTFGSDVGTLPSEGTRIVNQGDGAPQAIAGPGTPFDPMVWGLLTTTSIAAFSHLGGPLGNDGPTPVPEPATLLLVSLACVGYRLGRRRRR